MASIIWNEKKNKRFEVAKRRLKKGFWHFFFVFFPFRLHSSSSCLLLYTIHVSIAPASEKKRNEGNHQKNFFSFLYFQWNRIMRATSWMETYNQEKSSKKKFFSSVSMWQKILSFYSIFSFLIWRNKKKIIFKEQSNTEATEGNTILAKLGTLNKDIHLMTFYWFFFLLCFSLFLFSLSYIFNSVWYENLISFRNRNFRNLMEKKKIHNEFNGTGFKLIS